jgi:hypothetical protein
MTFYEVLEQVVTLLQRHGRVSYRALTRQFQLYEAYLEDLKAELVEVQRVAMDQDGTMLVWTGFVANFAQEVVKGQLSLSVEGIRRPGRRTVRPQCGPRFPLQPPSAVS